MNEMDLEVRRLLAHIDRVQARRFLVNPEPPTGFADFSESRRDAIGLVQQAALAERPEAADEERDILRAWAEASNHE